MSQPQLLEIGDLVTMKTRFANSAGVLTNPTTVTLTITDPDGVITTLTSPNVLLLNPSTGVWSSDLTLTKANVWMYRWSGTGAVVSGETGYFVVQKVGFEGVKSGPCSNWISADDLTSCPGVPETASEGQIEQAIATASDLLWRWSGYKYGGLCFDSVRPCSQNSYLEGTYSWDRPQGWSGGWWNWIPSWGYCMCQASSHRGCGCSYLSQITLGRSPIRGIVQVRIDGAVVSPTAYRVDDNEWLVRIDGNRWPCCQDLTLSDAVPAGGGTALNTFGVDFIWGQEPPASGIEAAIDLARETVKACVGGDCALPEEFAQIVRQGETRINIQPTDFGRDSQGNIREGIRSVDRFLSAAPHSRPLVIASPDIDAKVTRTG